MEASFRQLDKGSHFNIGENYQATTNGVGNEEFSPEEEELLLDLLSEAKLTNSVEQENIKSFSSDSNCSFTVNTDCKIDEEMAIGLRSSNPKRETSEFVDNAGFMTESLDDIKPIADEFEDFRITEMIVESSEETAKSSEETAKSSEETAKSSEETVLADAKTENDEAIIKFNANVATAKVQLEAEFIPNKDDLLIFNILDDGRVLFKFLKDLDSTSAKKHDAEGGEYASISGNKLLVRSGCGLKEGDKHKINGKKLTVVFMTKEQEAVLRRFVTNFIAELRKKESEEQEKNKTKKFFPYQINQSLFQDDLRKQQVQYKVSDIDKKVNEFRRGSGRARQNYLAYLAYAEIADSLKEIIFKRIIKKEISYSEDKIDQVNYSIDKQTRNLVQHKVFSLTTLTLNDFNSKNGLLSYHCN